MRDRALSQVTQLSRGRTGFKPGFLRPALGLPKAVSFAAPTKRRPRSHQPQPFQVPFLKQGLVWFLEVPVPSTGPGAEQLLGQRHKGWDSHSNHTGFRVFNSTGSSLLATRPELCRNTDSQVPPKTL